MKSLRVATCQFSVEGDIQHNRRWILKQIRRAADQEAHVVHFSECALSGYAGVDIPNIAALDWDQLIAATEAIQEAARSHRIWVLLGSTHRLSGGNKPHNSVYIINPAGKIVDRYDKRFCTGSNNARPTLDLAHYTPGNRFVTFKILGFTCGVLICYDYRFPELYRQYSKLGWKFYFNRSTMLDPASLLIPTTTSGKRSYRRPCPAGQRKITFGSAPITAPFGLRVGPVSACVPMGRGWVA